MTLPSTNGLAVFTEALAVGALIHRGMLLVSADLDISQTAVVHILTMVGAAADGAFDGRVRCAMAAVIGASLGHGTNPPVNKKVRQKCLTLVCPVMKWVCTGKFFHFYMPSR